ncbi:sigma-70 family RNA polymerase sigma factor [Lactobacillus hominis]|uniref:DNA-directed RNA polymerase sigma factor n=1 Tax=Lactobacillus hominis DSM 23910 = CRBIP 24.179 TaxID=1423758 RepID=I7KGE1_9LACO|nr:sigma-70 family RNA polymerase sigma factor [Lactobacillus hominis]KRM85397.1 RNA polymerase sigma factor, sigma-70 family [Lactobacillus hominis DSM 23910 = CRBIP 24.179]MCT3347525.1 sigma-70 family RNA polymerase sigma factor [Lactobacillus hominis]CCI81185.1 DNA-directed RNA polymerase sigma factor [Lactobacillus hominis DSM 23910 = CRBIP 24.179]
MKYFSDYELIEKVKAKDNDALFELTMRYQPVVNNVRSQIYIRHFDIDDWMQEALIICYETCCLFDLKKSKDFGAFFKANFVNHAKNLLRYELAKQREPYSRAVSYEVIKESGAINESSIELSEYPVNARYQYFLSKLSITELYAFLVLLGKLDIELAAQKAACGIEQLITAKGRIKRKMLEVFNFDK